MRIPTLADALHDPTPISISARMKFRFFCNLRKEQEEEGQSEEKEALQKAAALALYD
jgi:hypothetical protein